jgi:hypothetical protein
MMKIISFVVIIIILIMPFIFSCNMEVNTSDAQASPDINSSKQSGFFISEYNSSVIPQKVFHIKEAWVESIWFNKIRNGQVVKEKINAAQLILKLDSFTNSEFADDQYLFNWRMKDVGNHSVGKGNGVYIFSYENDTIPDTIHISILKVKEDRTTQSVHDFLLIKSK